MVTFPIIQEDCDVIYHLPTHLEEITPNYLKAITKEVHVADHYSLVALVCYEKISTLVLARQRKTKNANVGIVPIFVKNGNTDSQFISSIKTGEKVVVSSTQISLGLHVNVPQNELNLDKFLANIDKDIELPYQRAIALEDQSPVFFISFKLIPNADIIGVYSTEDRPIIDSTFVEIQAKAKE